MTNTGKLDRDIILRSLTVDSVARQYNIKLPPKSNGVCKCPFKDHRDSTPSFSVNFENGLWKCHGCGRDGDMLTMIAEMEGLEIIDDFKEILEKAADIAGVPRNIAAQDRRGNKRKYKEAWDKNKDGDLAAARSVYIAKKKIDITTLGIEIRPDRGNDFTVPIRDWRGEMIGLQRGSKFAVEESNSGGFFFENIDRKETLYIVEGLSDYLTMLACGYTNVVGLFSANTPDAEIKSLVGTAHDVKICLDYDHYDKTGAARGSQAGFKKSKDILRKIPHALAYFASYTERLDISDIFCEKGDDAVRELFDRPGKNYDDLEHDHDNKIAPSLDPRIVAEAIALRDMIATGLKEHWAFIDGIWQEVSVNDIEDRIKKEFLNRGAAGLQFKKITEARNFLRLETGNRISKINSALMQDDLQADYLYFSDGKYDIEADKFSPYTPSDYIFSRLAVPFETADHPPKKLIEFLNQLFDGYEKPEEYIEFIQEWVGYCLFPKTPIHAFLYVYGSGGNGKGVLFNVINSLVGHDNSINYNIHKLEEGGERAIIQLFGRYVNLGTEEKRGTNLGSPILKSLTGGDPVTGRRLYREAFTFRPFTKMLFSSNHAPSGAEDASNISRRLSLLHLKNVFDDGEGKRGDSSLLDKIMADHEAVTWWAVQGLKRLLKRGHFLKPEAMRSDEKAMLERTDPISAFVQRAQHFSLNGLAPVSLKVLYEEFKTFYTDDLGKPMRYTPSKQSFADGLGKHGYAIVSFGDVMHVTKLATEV